MKLRPDVSATVIDNGMVLLDEKLGKYWQLNPSGTCVLRIFLAGGTHQQAVRALSDSYGISVERADADVRALLDTLRTARLVRP